MKLKVLRFALACLLVTLSVLCFIFAPIKEINAIGWDDDYNGQFGNDTIVRFGLYSYEDMGIELSQPDYFFDHIKYGLAHGIYNYYKTLYGDNANFPSEVSIIYNRLENIFGREFFTLLSEQRFLLNVYVNPNSNNVQLLFSRVPETNSAPIFNRVDKGNGYIQYSILPEGYKTSFFFLTMGENNHRHLWWVSPYYISGDLISSTNSYQTITWQTFTDLEDIKSALTNSNLRSFNIQLSISTPSIDITPNFQRQYNVYYNSNTLKMNAIDFGTYKPICLMSDFPIYENTYNTIPVTQSGYEIHYYYNRSTNYVISNEYSPILITGYESIPQVTPTPTFTPTPQPTWTPYPTATPFPPVNEIEGISQMMTLFTRKYEFNINGNVIGIRPLYLFVFTFLVGAIFKAIQGGDRN